MSSYHLKSHPDKPLVHHLNNVSKSSAYMLKELQECTACLSDPQLLEIIKIIGFTHDTGKCTSFFQEYLHNHDIKFSPFLKSHSTLSSIYAYYATRHRNLNNNFLSFLAVMLIQGHHGRIPSPSTVVKRIEEHRTELEQQFKNLLHTEELDGALNSQNLPNFLNAKSVLNDYNAAAFHNKLKIPFDIAVQKHEQSLKRYFIANMLFSILIDADRLDAADLDVRKRYDVDPQLIANYINGIKKESLQKFGDKLNSIVRLRSYVLRSVLEKLAIARNNRVFSLTAPTGSGKTLTAFLFANMLRHEIYQETKRRARIIYVLPFLSIIDQNAKVIQEALELKHGWQTGMMVTHHHLSKLEYYDMNAGKESYSSAESELIIEGWHSEVIITTFVQFLETIIGTSASYLRKLHNIPGSIVILDEVQSIDYKHWLLVHECLKFMAEEFNTRIILMTATQPLIFTEENKEILELVDTEYHKFLLERVQLKLDLKNGIYLDGFIKKINELIDESSDKSILIIMNTIQSAVNVFEKTHGNEYEKFYLSSEVIPIERQERIKVISERLDKRERTILISTQVVEAGVDFDFDIVVRDLAPIDSIIQAAGRCNRNGSRPREDSPVYIFDVRNEKNSSYAPKIYGNFLIEKTRETLSEAESKISTGELYLSELVEIYYRRVKDGGSKHASTDVLKTIEKLNYDELKFSVIEDEPNVSIFIEVDKQAEEIWQEYQGIVKTTSEEEKRKKLRYFFRTKRHIFYNYVINSFPDIAQDLGIQFEKPFFYVEKRLVSKCYNKTGLRRG